MEEKYEGNILISINELANNSPAIKSYTNFKEFKFKKNKYKIFVISLKNNVKKSYFNLCLSV